MMSSTRDLHVPSQSDIASIRTHMVAALAPWTEKWCPSHDGLPPSPVDVEVAFAGPQDATRPWQESKNEEAPTVWRQVKEGAIETLASLLLGCAQSHAETRRTEGDWSLTIADTAMKELEAALCKPLPKSMASLPASLPDQFKVYSGAIIVTLAPIGLALLLPRSACHSLLPRHNSATGLTKGHAETQALSQILATRSVKVELLLDEVEVPLHDLLTLQPGDVLRLGPGLDAPLSIQIEGRRSALTARVGGIGEHVALQASRGPSSPSSHSLPPTP